MRVFTVSVACVLALALWARSGAAQGRDGQALFHDNCSGCHGPKGKPPQAIKGLYPKIPTFNAAFFGSRSRDSVVVVLNRGVGKEMPSFKGKLTPEEIQAVANYVRTTLVGVTGKE